jgi:glycosyltransferase involved in cell wall biosynthesis
MTHTCIVNLGLYRTGTTTLGKAFRSLGFKVYREWPVLSEEQIKCFLTDPKGIVQEWWVDRGGSHFVLELINTHHLVCDGWFPLLVFLPPAEFERLRQLALKAGTCLRFVVTTRETGAIVSSELHHWIRHVLEKEAGLADKDRTNLEETLRARSILHANAVATLTKYYSDSSDELRNLVNKLPLSQIDKWPKTLANLPLEGFHTSSNLSRVEESIKDALCAVGVQNGNPKLPVEGILVTLKLSDARGLEIMLSSIEQDPLCRYLLVLALDHDEFGTEEDAALRTSLQERPRLGSFYVIRNPRREHNESFKICQVWHKMAEKAWEKGASWVVLLGDDISIECPYHYRIIYRSFLDIQKLGYPLWFGCPWFNDRTFPGFPTFPIVGRLHKDIFNGLIPENRRSSFCNQDLDPYLQRLYLKFGAAPLLKDAFLTNGEGGTDTSEARYRREPADGWRDWVLDDIKPIEAYLSKNDANALSKALLDVVVPTYRLNQTALKKICSLQVPDGMITTFIIIVDNPELLLKEWSTIPEAISNLERNLATKTSNDVRVRCNAKNVGASASRNRGIEESSAEYILFLDDDVKPEDNLLEQYHDYLTDLLLTRDFTEHDLVGLVGLVQFPRSPNLPLKHAAVLMSYLIFMFEIATKQQGMYREPAWGVTANLLVKRIPGLRFDTDYAKTGGGEDVDFCLRLGENGGRLIAAPKAKVTHDFWDGSILDLSSHFFNWAIGDSALFTRFPSHCYRSWPNVVELAFLILAPWVLCMGIGRLHQYLLMTLCFAGVDCIVDLLNVGQFRHRCSLLQYRRPIWFLILSHILANIYVMVLETGRLKGHLKRKQLSNIGKRFDWHCRRLNNSWTDFRRIEAHKFILFLSVLTVFVLKEIGCPQIVLKAQLFVLELFS